MIPYPGIVCHHIGNTAAALVSMFHRYRDNESSVTSSSPPWSPIVVVGIILISIITITTVIIIVVVITIVVVVVTIVVIIVRIYYSYTYVRIYVGSGIAYVRTYMPAVSGS